MAPQPLARDVLLRDGSTLRLRAPGPEDLEDLKASYDRLSPESRYLPLHGYGRTDVAAAAADIPLDAAPSPARRAVIDARHHTATSNLIGPDRLANDPSALIQPAATNVTQTRGGEDGGRRHSPAPPPRPTSRPQTPRRD